MKSIAIRPLPFFEIAEIDTPRSSEVRFQDHLNVKKLNSRFW